MYRDSWQQNKYLPGQKTSENNVPGLEPEKVEKHSLLYQILTYNEIAPLWNCFRIAFEAAEVVKGLSINDVTALEGGGGQGFFDESTKVLAIKSVTMEGGGKKNVKNCVKSFIDDPLIWTCVKFNLF